MTCVAEKKENVCDAAQIRRTQSDSFSYSVYKIGILNKENWY